MIRSLPMHSQAAWHPRNRHQGRYDIERLTRAHPELGDFVRKSPKGELTVNFADPGAVRALNKALLAYDYGLAHWEIPPGYLCPPIPSRADYLHHAADLLASSERGGTVPRGGSTRVLDIGVGANCIYPIIGHCEYGWRFVGVDTDPNALASAELIVKSNPKLSGQIDLRRQTDPKRILVGVIGPEDRFALTVCNPPFHASLEEARRGNARKRRNLGLDASAPALNFGGQGSELCYPGGEAGFVARMIAESARFRAQVAWFTTLVSKEATLPGAQRALKAAHASELRTIALAHGQKKSRILAWTFGAGKPNPRPSQPA